MRLRSLLFTILAITLASACSAPPPVDSGALRYRVREEPLTLDPHRVGDNNSLAYIYAIFDGLVEFVPGSLDVRPAVAESWTVSDDGLTYTFTLREGVRFHNGREVTANDVVYSLRRGLSRDAKSQKHDFLAPLVGSAEFWDGSSSELPGVQAPDPKTVVMTLSYPYSAFLTILAGEAGSILPEEVYTDPDEKLLRHPVGCGPFRFEGWDPEISITLSRFEDHWKGRAEPGAIRAIEFLFIRDATSAMEEYRAGNIDFTYELPPGQRDRLLREMPDHLHHGQQLSIFFLAFNHAAGPFTDPRLRRAVSHAIDRDYIVKNLQQGKDRLATGVIPPGMLGHRPDVSGRTYDVELARRLLAEAGYPGGEGLPELVYLSNDTQGFRRVAERLQSDLARVGIKTQIEMMDLTGFYTAITDPAGLDAAFFRMTWYADWPDPDNFLAVQFSTDGGANFSRYSNPVFDDVMARARQEPDPERREELYRQGDAILIEEDVLVPVYWYGEDLLLRPEFDGFKQSPLGAFAIAWEELRRKG